MSRGRRLAIVALAVAVAAVAFVLARPGEDDGGGTGATTPADTARTATTGPAKRRPPRPSYERIRVRGGEPVGGVADLTVSKGDTVRIAISSDTADEVHVHGYDLLEDVAAGGTVRLRFEADIEGVFEIELEGAHVQLAKLTVEP